MHRSIYLVRHCEIDCGKDKHYIGITDLPLNDEGKTRAYRLKEYFSGINIEKAYTSPLTRCIQTSEIILEGKKLEKIQVDELKEINMGEWEGKSFEYIKNRFPEQYARRGMEMDLFIPPGGESFLQLQKRVMPAFYRITDGSEGNILIIAHAGVNRVILCGLLGFPLNRVMSFNQPYGCTNVLFWDTKHQSWNHEMIY